MMYGGKMQILKQTTKGSVGEMYIEHRGETLSWNMKTYRSLNMNDYTIADINKYWEGLTLDAQDRIFALYKAIRETFDNIELTKRLDEKLLHLVTELMKYHEYKDILKYYQERSTIKMPEDLKDNYVKDLEPDLTYLKKDYPELICLTIAMKAMLPIFGEYISAMNEELGSQFSPYAAAGLLRHSDVVNSPGYLRLVKYVNAYWEGYVGDFSSAAVLSGLDKAQVPEYMLANVLVRRLANAKIVQTYHPDPPSAVIITRIYNFIKMLAEALDKNFGGRVHDKGITDRSTTEDDNTSVIENYKIKQEVSEGVIALHEVFLKTKGIEIIKRIDETCPENYYHEIKAQYNKAVEEGYTLLNDDMKYQSTIMKWTLDPVVTAKSIDEVSYHAFLEGLFITHALLRHWGFKHIYVLLFAKKTQTNVYSATVSTKITDKQLERLNEIYPHRPKFTTRRQPSRADSNVAVIAIRTLLNEIGSAWYHLAPWDKREEYPDLLFNGESFSFPADLERVIADFVIFTRGVNHVKLYSLN